MPPEAQYVHRPNVLLPYPQLSGSLELPVMHWELERELAGKAQLVKSARICVVVSSLGFAHKSESETT